MISTVKIPKWVYDVCSEWYDGSGSMMYAITSTGGLTRGSIRPLNASNDDDWYYQLYLELSAEVSQALRLKQCEELSKLDAWVDIILENLEYYLDLTD